DVKTACARRNRIAELILPRDLREGQSERWCRQIGCARRLGHISADESRCDLPDLCGRLEDRCRGWVYDFVVPVSERSLKVGWCRAEACVLLPVFAKMSQRGGLDRMFKEEVTRVFGRALHPWVEEDEPSDDFPFARAEVFVVNDRVLGTLRCFDEILPVRWICEQGATAIPSLVAESVSLMEERRAPEHDIDDVRPRARCPVHDLASGASLASDRPCDAFPHHRVECGGSVRAQMPI